MKDAYYLKHDSNAHRDPRMMRLRAKWGNEGYGAFWLLAEVLREQCGGAALRADVGVLAVEVRFERLNELVTDCCEWGLLACDDERVWSPRMRRDMEALEAVREQAREAGRRGNEIRWGSRPDSDPIPPASGNHRNERIGDIGEDKLGEDSVPDTSEKPIGIPYVAIIKYLNDKAETSYSPDSKATRELIKARWHDGFRGPDFAGVIGKMTAKWGKDDKMRQFLRPSTLFRKSHFEEYLNG